MLSCSDSEICWWEEEATNYSSDPQTPTDPMDLDEFCVDEFYCDDAYSFSNEFGARVALEYVKHFNFVGLRVDAALRGFLAKFCLVGESSERERILTYFAKRYQECNPGIFQDDGKPGRVFYY